MTEKNLIVKLGFKSRAFTFTQNPLRQQKVLLEFYSVLTITRPSTRNFFTVCEVLKTRKNTKIAVYIVLLGSAMVIRKVSLFSEDIYYQNLKELQKAQYTTFFTNENYESLA